LQANEVNILTAGVPVQLDGEAAGFTPVRLSILPDAIELLVP
jgi:diacylglycerol kinase family enzyme